MLQTEIYVKRKQRERKLVRHRERKRKKQWKRGGREDCIRQGQKHNAHLHSLEC